MVHSSASYFSLGTWHLWMHPSIVELWDLTSHALTLCPGGRWGALVEEILIQLFNLHAMILLKVDNYINILAPVHPKQFTIYIQTWKEGTKASFLHNPRGLLFGMESTHSFAKLLNVYSYILQFSLRIQEMKTVGFHRKVTKSTGILCTNSLVRIINVPCAL